MQPSKSLIELTPAEPIFDTVQIKLEEVSCWIFVCELLIDRYAQFLQVQQRGSNSFIQSEGRTAEEAITEYYLQKIELYYHLIRFGADRNEEQESIFLYDSQY